MGKGSAAVNAQEMLDSAFQICGALDRICCIGDGDTGYGNAVNVKRTVKGYAQAGMAGIMIEDQARATDGQFFGLFNPFVQLQSLMLTPDE